MRGSARKYARVVGYALGHWPKLLAILSLTLLLAAVAALAPWPLKILVDYGLGGLPPPEFLRGALAAAGIDASAANLVIGAALAGIAVFAANATLDAVVTWAWSGVGQRMVYDLAGDLFLRLQQLSLLFHARRHVGDSIARITGDAWCVHGVTDGILISPVKHLFVLAAVGGLAWQLDAALTLLTLTAAPLLAGSALYFGERLKSFERQKREAQARIASFLHQVLGAMPTGAGFCRWRAQPGDFRRPRRECREGQPRRSARDRCLRCRECGLAVTAGIALGLYAGGQRVLAHELSLGTLLVFIAYLRTVETASRGLLKSYGGLRAAEASIDRVLEILDADEKPCATLPGARALPALHPPAVARPRLRQGELRLRRWPAGAEGDFTPPEPGRNRGAGRRDRRRQDDARFADPALLRSGRRPGAARRHGLARRQLASLRGQVAIVLQEPFLLAAHGRGKHRLRPAGASRDEIIAAAAAPPTRTSSSGACRRATTRSSASRAARSRAASASASPSRARSSRTRRS